MGIEQLVTQEFN